MKQLEKELYQHPTMEVTEFSNDDIITTSDYESGENEGDPL